MNKKIFIQDEQLLASITSILIGLDVDGRIHYWNAVAEKTLHIPAADVLKRHLWDCAIPWDSQRVGSAIKECQERKAPVPLNDLLFTHPNGRKGYLGFTINPLFERNGGISGFLLFGADITQKKENEKQLRIKTEQLQLAKIKIEKEKAKYEALLTSIGDGMIAMDEGGKIIMMNEQAERMLDWPAPLCLGRPFHEVLTMRDEKGRDLPLAKHPWALSLATKEKVSQTAYYVRRDGTSFPAAITVSPIVMGGKVIGTIEIFRDVTREKEIDRMKSEFISTVSHELRTPLTSVREAIAQILEQILGPINDSQKEYLKISLDELDRLAAIVNDLLDVGKIESGKIELKQTHFDICSLIRKVAKAHHRVLDHKGLSLQIILPEQPVWVHADFDKITQVVTNLISNAYKFTATGGEISVEVRAYERECWICVKDTGCGLSRDDLERVFERFVQVGRTYGPGRKGTGLGLAICKSLIELHGGKIWAESEPRKGARFYFTLPLEGEKDRAASDKDAAEEERDPVA